MKSIISLVFLVVSAIVYAQQITKDGSRYKFENTIYTSYEIGEILKNDFYAKPFYDNFRSKSKKGKDITLIGGSLVIGAIAYGYFVENDPICDGPCIPFSGILGASGVVISLAGFVTSASGYTNLNKSIKVYNQNHAQSDELSYIFNIGVTESGIGISYTF